MKNSIVETYLQSLKTPNFKPRYLVSEFKAALSKVKSYSELYDLICTYLAEEPADLSDANAPILKSPGFFHTLKGWKQSLDQDAETARTIRENLENLSAPEALVSFIKQLLANPDNLLHQRIPGLLKHLDLAHLQETLEALARLPEAPWPAQILPGDYLAIQPFNELHSQCIRLLNNNSRAFDENNIYWVRANSILQTVLLIFEDLRPDAPSLESLYDDLDFDQPKSCCVLI